MSFRTIGCFCQHCLARTRRQGRIDLARARKGFETLEEFLYRADRDLRELTSYSDFLKIVVYNNCAGERMARHIETIRQGALGDFTSHQLLEFSYRILNYRERSFDQIPYTGLSSDHVYREARHAVESVAGTAANIYPGIDIGVPSARQHSKRTPHSARDAVAPARPSGSWVPSDPLSREPQ